MAVVRRRKANRKKKPTRRAYKPRMHLKNSVNMGLGFPKKLLVKQKYSENHVLNPFVATDSYIYALNGIMDTNYTGVGHQPMFFDQFMGLYTNYCVIGCKMKVSMVPYSSNPSPVIAVLWQNDDYIITPTSTYAKTEQSKAKKIVMNGNSGKNHVLTLNWSAKKSFGSNIISNLDYCGSAGFNPKMINAGVITLASADGSDCKVLVSVDLEFIVVYLNLKDVSSS
ncbi:MAG: capsid protein [Circoviridae sp.]|nr:MAG: capsid protein [Circoviridae sp.]